MGGEFNQLRRRIEKMVRFFPDQFRPAAEAPQDPEGIPLLC